MLSTQHKSTNNYRCIELPTVLARLVTTLGSSFKETPSKNWNIAANVARELNTLACKYRKEPAEVVAPPLLDLAQLSYVANIITELVDTEKLLNPEAKALKLKKRSQAHRALLVALALVESGAMLASCYSKQKVNMFNDIAAVTSVVHSIAATQNKHAKLVNAATLVFLIKELSSQYQEKN